MAEQINELKQTPPNYDWYLAAKKHEQFLTNSNSELGNKVKAAIKEYEQKYAIDRNN